VTGREADFEHAAGIPKVMEVRLENREAGHTTGGRGREHEPTDGESSSRLGEGPGTRRPYAAASYRPSTRRSFDLSSLVAFSPALLILLARWLSRYGYYYRKAYYPRFSRSPPRRR